MLSINTNISSLIAQNSLQNSTLKLNQAVERMSTGYKINHAADNAANYSIVTNMTTKIGAYQVAEDNCAMGLDMLTTASDSLNLISDKLARLRALAEQAANGTYGKQSINAINTEAKAIVDEMYRVKNNTEYNGQKLFGKSPIDEGNVGASGLEVNEQGFLQDVVKRDTSSMTKIESVSESTTLAKGTYSISTADELAKLARMQNAGKITVGSEFVLAADIDLSEYSSGEGWVPIGGSNGTGNGYGNASNQFNSTLDGNGYKITNLYINSNRLCRGLIGAAAGGTVKNLGIESGEIKSNQNEVGAIIGWNNGSINISNCFSKINITGKSNTGGMIGQAGTAEIDYCYSTGNVTRANTDTTNVGGLIGSGGGNGYLTVTNSFATGNILGFNSAGGLIGYSYSLTLTNCFATGNVSADNRAGGLAGGAGGGSKINNSHSTGDVSGNFCIGGLVASCGNGVDLIKNCYTTGNVSGDDKVGGIIAWIVVTYNNKQAEITNCHTTGKVSGNSAFGSIAGSDETELYTIKDCTYNGGEPTGIGKAVLENVQDASLNIGLQVGINSDENSQIQLNSLFVLGGFKDILVLGLQSNKALNIIDNYIARASEVQTTLGSTENRLESALEGISTHYENLSSSRSTLKDTDIANVSSQYIKQQILQQASATLLATANQSPSIALQLI